MKRGKKENQEPIQKWQREEGKHWEDEGKNKNGNWISFRSGKGEQVGNEKKGQIQAQVQIF